MVYMGKLEQEAKSERRKGYVQKALLSVIAISGILVVAAVAPNVLQLIGGYPRGKYQFNHQLKSAASKLANKGLVRFEKRDGRNYMEITARGRQLLEHEQQREALLQRAKKRWDKRWRMVVFDIPEKYRKTRDRLRSTLRSLGFIQLQASVWVYPYDCEEVVTLLKTELKTGAQVLYAIVEKIEFDSRLRKHFNV